MVSSDASIAIAFGVFGAITGLISLVVGYLTLRATTFANKEATTRLSNEYGLVLRHEHTHFTAQEYAAKRGGLEKDEE